MGSFERTNKPYFTTVKLITTLFFYNCQNYAVCSLVKHAESVCTNDFVWIARFSTDQLDYSKKLKMFRISAWEHMITCLFSSAVAHESVHISQKALQGKTVPLHCTAKISLSHNSSGQFQTTQNDKGINFPG